MKLKVLCVFLCISVLLNTAGLVFFISFLRLQGSYKALKRENATMANNLNAARATNASSGAQESGQFVQRAFTSHVDGEQDAYALAPPATPGRLDNTLIVYLHGMGSTILEPFTNPPERNIAQSIAMQYPNVAILSCSYRGKSSWGSDAAMSDITQNIRAVMHEYPIKRIVIMGTSMGGCTALTYAAVAPSDVKDKLAGVVSVEGAGDLQELATVTNNKEVAAALMVAMGGSFAQVPNEYKRRSFLPNLDKLPKSTRTAIVCASRDRVVPPELQEEIARTMSDRGYENKLLKIDGPHGVPVAAVYVQGLNYVLSK